MPHALKLLVRRHTIAPDFFLFVDQLAFRLLRTGPVICNAANWLPGCISVDPVPRQGASRVVSLPCVIFTIASRETRPGGEIRARVVRWTGADTAFTLASLILARSVDSLAIEGCGECAGGRAIGLPRLREYQTEAADAHDLPPFHRTMWQTRQTAPDVR